MSRETLAIDGGTPVLPDGPPNWPVADDDVMSALQQAYVEGNWGQYHGPHCQRLQSLLSAMHDGAHVWLCCSGTFAVELALRALKIGDGDEVILAGYDFGGNFRSVESVGARPVLVDIDPATWCIAAEQFERAIDTRTRAVIVSHLHGGITPMKMICEISARASVKVVEDACQAHGASVQGRTAGTWGDVGILSFGGSKLLTAGRGGALLTSHADVFQRAKIFCERGNDAFPLSELQAAVLAPQVEKLAERNARRLENGRRAIARLQSVAGLQPIQLSEADGDCPSLYKIAWRYDASQLHHRSRAEFAAAVRAEGVALDEGFRGFTRRGKSRCSQVGDLRNSADAAEHTLVLHHPVLLESPEYIEKVAAAIRKVSAAYSAKSQNRNVAPA